MYFVLWKSTANNQWYWSLKSANHEIIAASEGYVNKSGAEHSINLVKATNSATRVIEV